MSKNDKQIKCVLVGDQAVGMLLPWTLHRICAELHLINTILICCDRQNRALFHLPAWWRIPAYAYTATKMSWTKMSFRYFTLCVVLDGMHLSNFMGTFLHSPSIRFADQQQYVGSGVCCWWGLDDEFELWLRSAVFVDPLPKKCILVNDEPTTITFFVRLLS